MRKLDSELRQYNSNIDREFELLHHVGTARSLWNYAVAPGWTHQEIEILKLALMKHGVGKWSEIVAGEYLPTKNISQLYCQT